MKSEVVIVGAGASGIPAAIGAARAGAEVILVEEDGVIGGATTDYYVDMLCGGPVSGVMREAQILLQRHFSPTPEALFFLPDSFQRVFWRLLRAEPKITVVSGARINRVTLSKNRIVSVQADTGVDSVLSIAGSVFIDATGTGELAVLAGGRSMYGREGQADFGEPHAPPNRDEEIQECTWMYISQKLGDGPEFDMMQLDNVYNGVLVNGLGWFHEDPDRALALGRGLYLHWGCRVRCADTRDGVAVATAQTEALGLMERDHALLREAGYAVYTAPKLGIRESRRILGEKVVSENDLFSAKLPDDTIALGTYGIDIWGEESEEIPAHTRNTTGYGIPYGALIPRGIDNLLLAGRSISGTHIGMSAYRVMPIAASIGQAAGVVAALSAGRNPSPGTVDPTDIRKILKKQKVALTMQEG